MAGIFVAFAWADSAGAHSDDLVAVLLIGLIVLVALLAIIINRVIGQEKRNKKKAAQPEVPPSYISTPSFIEAPVRWLAVRAQDVRLVQSTLGVQNPRACAWSDALIHSLEAHLFIAPPVRGWIIVMGSDLPDPADDVDACFLFLTRLSEKLGEVQYYVRHRAVSHHGWVRLEAGKVRRAYCWAGETLWNQGAVTEAERELKLRCLTYAESADVLGLAERDVLSINTDKVIRLAGQWSVDPTSIEAEVLEGEGVAGEMAK